MINANYYRIRKTIIQGLSKIDIDKIDKELKKYIHVIDTFTPQQMAVFSLLVEQGAVVKSNHNFDRFAASMERAITGYFANRDDFSWQDVIAANEKVSELLIQDHEKEDKIYKQSGGNLETMGSVMKKTLECIENRAKELVSEGLSQKKAIEELKKEAEEKEMSKLNVVSMILEGENGKYIASVDGVKLDFAANGIDFKNEASVDEFTNEIKEVFRRMKHE